MDTQPATGNDDHIRWESATSEKGVAYEVTMLNKTKAALAEMSEAIAVFNKKELASQDLHNLAERLRGGADPGIKDIDVNWTVIGDVWKKVDPNQTAYITRYSLHLNHWSPIWDWMLEFSTTRKGSYQFVDETGDRYDVEVYVVGDHYVRFNSPQPTIKEVKYRASDSGVGF